MTVGTGPAEPQAAADLVLAEARRWLPDGGLERSGATLTSVPGDWSDVGGLPTGTLPVAAGRALALAALGAARAGEAVTVDADAVAATVLLPLVVAAATGTDPAARPPAPWPTVDGAVCADLGAEGDADAFGRLLEVLGPGPLAAEELSARAQEWRLPVTPYRRRPQCGPATVPWRARDRGRGPKACRDGAGVGWPPLAGVTVLDLTVMWSGPLCTALLGALGAEVVKIEPACRPDGTRSSPGGALFRALNQGKEVAPLDLRRADDRAGFLTLVAGADLVVDNFSPRVAPNLRIEPAALRAVNARLATLSLPAFPVGPERQWVSYGTGIHAICGLGEVSGGRRRAAPAFAAPAVTYPDPLGGLAGAVTALALLNRRDGFDPPGAAGAGYEECGWRAEVPLATSVASLVAVPDQGSLTRRLDPTLVDALARRFGPVPPSPVGPADRTGGKDGRNGR